MRDVDAVVYLCNVCREKNPVGAVEPGRGGTAEKEVEGEDPTRANLELLSVTGLPPKGSTCTLEVGTTDALPPLLPAFSFKLLLRTSAIL